MPGDTYTRYPELRNNSLATVLKSGKKKIAIVGEIHDEISMTEEIRKWEQEGLKVVYEADKINLGEDNEIVPDSIILKLGEIWNKRYSMYNRFWNTDFLKADSIYGSYLSIHFEYRAMLGLSTEYANKLGDEGLKDLIAQHLLNLEEMKAYKEVNRNALNIIDLGDKVRKGRLGWLRLLKKIQDTLKGTVDQNISLKDYDFTLERSRNMITATIRAAARKELEPTIYKVGDRHIEDIKSIFEEKGYVDEQVIVLDRVEYIREWEKL
ncbi:hypothetical protein [Xanthovirga aplysinae]|uniref:hypothetical protein n=1 Tax=Xanthovirga aplysinae TaxID=2529853 RepID=UPI0012BD4929|nr:hypothetical protein [Xanthovirga aplysinae]MTI29673.1 hypothetical protein [Xanthovirga aplysinae]